MFSFIKRAGVIILAGMFLMSFRLVAPQDDFSRFAYDVRRAFVAARPEVSHDLMRATDRMVADAIKATTRKTAAPRVVLTIRINYTEQEPFFLGSRYSAEVMVKAVAIGDGEVIAQGTFSTSVLMLDQQRGDIALAAKIAERIRREFALERSPGQTLAAALYEGR